MNYDFTKLIDNVQEEGLNEVLIQPYRSASFVNLGEENLGNANLAWGQNFFDLVLKSGPYYTSSDRLQYDYENLKNNYQCVGNGFLYCTNSEGHEILLQRYISQYFSIDYMSVSDINDPQYEMSFCTVFENETGKFITVGAKHAHAFIESSYFSYESSDGDQDDLDVRDLHTETVSVVSDPIKLVTFMKNYFTKIETENNERGN
jgi:hypothetical protein